jgi:uncharacterized protein (TIGR02246 family)
MNNHGADKLGFTAPSQNGVAAVVEQAYESAGIDPASVGYVEAHGTGTHLGDPTEVQALTRAFRRWTQERDFCALGSVKANLGHTDTAAGVIGLIKAALVLSHALIPPLAGFSTPNPLLDLLSTPFNLNATLLPWPKAKSPRRAGVNAMGVGGTNVHVLLQAPPPAITSGESRPWQILCLSARTETALTERARQLGAYFESHPDVELSDVAHTLALGRGQHKCRSAFICRNVQEAKLAVNSATTPVSAATGTWAKRDRPVVFLFPGHGVHYPRMGIELYEAEPEFKAEVERCCDIAKEVAGLELGAYYRGALPAVENTSAEIPYMQTEIFTIEYALAKQLSAWGIHPAMMLGHSIGEYVAACLGGVFSLRDAIALVALRGRLAEETPPGGMFLALAEAQAVAAYLEADVTIATYLPGSVVLTGRSDDLERTRKRLTSAGIETASIRASRPAHSPLSRGIWDTIRQHVARVERHASTIPIISNLTGVLMTAEQATNPEAWADMLCNPVRLEQGFGCLLELQSPICIELGPGNYLGSSLKRHRRFETAKVNVMGTLPDARKRKESSHKAFLDTLGKAWELGVEVDWKRYFIHERRRRIPLPTYPFERRQFVLGATPLPATTAAFPSQRYTRVVDVVRKIDTLHVDDDPEQTASTVPATNTNQDLGNEHSKHFEQIILDIWGRLLGTSHIPPDQSFFELGGDSLLAAQFFAELRTRTGIQIKKQAFIQNPTISGILTRLGPHAEEPPLPMASRAEPSSVKAVPAQVPTASKPTDMGSTGTKAAQRRDITGDLPECILPLHAAGTKLPFFCVHPIGGGALCYEHLAKSLDPDRPFYGIESPILQDRSAVPGSLEEMAARYVEAIRRIQPVGPYLLGGWSFGGTVAAEMTRQLQSLGQSIAILVLFDAPAAPSATLKFLHRADKRLAALSLLPSILAGSSEKTIREQGRDEVARLTDFMTVATKSIFVCNTHLTLWLQYAWPELDVPTVHFVPASRPRIPTRLLGKTRSLTIRGLRIISVPGDHLSMLSKENIEHCSAQLRAILNQAVRETKNGSRVEDRHFRERTEASIRAFLDKFIEQMHNRDTEAMASIYTDDCLCVTTGEGLTEGAEMMRQHYQKRMPSLRHNRFNVHEWRIRVLADGRIGLVLGKLDSDQIFDEGARQVSYRDARMSMVLEKHEDSWRVLHLHYSLPVGGPLNGF